MPGRWLKSRIVPLMHIGVTLMAHLLLIDDDADLIPQQVRQSFPAPSHRVEVAATGAEGLERVRTDPPDVILLDLRLPDQSGLDVYHGIREIDARIPVVFVTMAKTADTAIEAMKQGAFDYLFKPLDLGQVRRVVGEALEVSRRMRAPAVVTETSPDPDVDGAILGGCPAMGEVYKAIGRVTGQDVTVLIAGETGTGKELIARAIYQHSSRAKAPFMALNCAAIPENLLESELFGHEKGAFTGADQRRIGRFEQANKGTLFLDEIGDLPPNTQVKLLRVLQQQTFQRVGGTETIHVDLRILEATHRNLEEMIREGKFREDLFHRLNVVCLQLPPLRERREDIPILVQHFLHKYSGDFDVETPTISSDSMAVLQVDSWPGNVRELENVTRRLLLAARGLSINADAVRQTLAARNAETVPAGQSFSAF